MMMVIVEKRLRGYALSILSALRNPPISHQEKRGSIEIISTSIKAYRIPMRTYVSTILFIEYRESKENKNDCVIPVLTMEGMRREGTAQKGGVLTQPSDSEVTLTDVRHISGF
jgi:hypothetical protein